MNHFKLKMKRLSNTSHSSGYTGSETTRSSCEPASGLETSGLSTDDHAGDKGYFAHHFPSRLHSSSPKPVVAKHIPPTRYDSHPYSTQVAYGSPRILGPAHTNAGLAPHKGLISRHRSESAPSENSCSQFASPSPESKEEEDLLRCIRAISYPFPPTRDHLKKNSSATGLQLGVQESAFNSNTELVDIDMSTLEIYCGGEEQGTDEGPVAPRVSPPSTTQKPTFSFFRASSPTIPSFHRCKASSAVDLTALKSAQKRDQITLENPPSRMYSPRPMPSTSDFAPHKRDLNAPLVLDLQTFQSYLFLEEFRTAFREWLALDPELYKDGLMKLDCYVDQLKAEALVKDVRKYSLCLYSVYHADGTQARSSFLPGSVVEDTLANLTKLAVLESGLEANQACLVSSLHENEFHLFIKSKLFTKLKNRRKLDIDSIAPNEIQRPSFCVTNPRVPNNPIVMVSTELLQLTGYEANEVIGKPCSMFNGRETSASSIYRVDTAFDAGGSCVEILLTYKKDGRASFCIWAIEPLHDSFGQVMFFVARQTDVTSELEVPLSSFLDLNIPRTTAADFNEKDIPCSPRMQDYQLQQRNFTSNQSKHLAKPPRNTSLHGSLKHNSSRTTSERSCYQQSLGYSKKEFCQSGRGVVKGLLRKRQSGMHAFDQVYSPPTLDHSFQIPYDPEPSPTGLEAQISSKPSHHLMIIKRRDHRIMYANEMTLKFFGLRMYSNNDNYEPALLKQDVLEFMHGRTQKSTRVLRNFAIELLARGRAGCCECEFNWNEVNNLDRKNTSKSRMSLSGELSTVHVSIRPDLQSSDLRLSNSFKSDIYRIVSLVLQQYHHSSHL
ncbi:hypothetical protein DFH28DRAFT_959134 [Melampsora americana]|nr:hypothetical protein DFH28DRAFT_959134 [Melampsora americana]